MLHHDVFELGVVLDRIQRHVFTVARLLEAAVGHLRHDRDVVVHPHRSEPEALGHSHRPPDVVGPHAVISPTINNLVEAVPRRSTSEQLTAREREVLELISMGKSNAQIATQLFIASRTVATHVEHILAKLGAANRAHASALGIRLGLIPNSLPGHLGIK